MLAAAILGCGFYALISIQSCITSGDLTAECRHNLIQIVLALHNYSNLNDDLYPLTASCIEKLPRESRLSWLAEVDPYVAHSSTAVFRTVEPWDSAYNRNLALKRDAAVFRCPFWGRRDARASQVVPFTHYVGVTGVGKDAGALPRTDRRAGIFGFIENTKLADVKDGLSNTMCVIETESHNGPWTAGGLATARSLDPASRPYIGKGRQFGGIHPGGVMIAFADGSVRFVRVSVDPKIIEAIATIAGGEAVNIDDTE